MQRENKVIIIGAGSMGGAIARGMVKANYIDRQNITLCDLDESKLNVFAAEGFSVSKDNDAGIEKASMLILAVKPYLIAQVAAEIKKSISNKHLIISVAANVSISKLEECFGSDKLIFRLVPNTAISVQESMTCICSNDNASEYRATVKEAFEQLGQVAIIDEKLIPAVTSLASCGTAFALRYLRAAMLGGIEMGLSANEAKRMAAQVAKGAAELLLSNNEDPESEIDKVCTPGGITIKGLNELEHGGFSSAVIKSLLSSYNEMNKG